MVREGEGALLIMTVAYYLRTWGCSKPLTNIKDHILRVFFGEVLSSKVQTHMSNCLLAISTWMSNRQLKFNMPWTKPLMSHPKPAAAAPSQSKLIATASIHCSDQQPWGFLLFLPIKPSTFSPSNRLMAWLSKYDQNPDTSQPPLLPSWTKTPSSFAGSLQ